MNRSSTPLRAQVISSLVWSAVRNWGSRLVSLITFVVLARYVDPRDMGLVAAALALMAFVEIFTEQGLGSAIVQRPEVTPALLNAAFAANLAAALVATVLIVAGAPWIARLMGTPELTDVLRVVSISLIFTALGFCQLAMCMRNFQYKWLAVRTLLATGISGVIGLWMVVEGYGVWGLVAQAVLVAAINTFIMWLKPQWRPSTTFDFAGLRSMLPYSANVFASQLFNYGNTRFIEIFLAATLGPVALGIYAVGMRIHQSLMQLLSSTVLEVAHSGFSRLAGDRVRLLAAYHEASVASAALAAPVLLLTGLLAPEVAEVVYGQRWLDSAAIMLPMSVLGAVQTMQFYNGGVLNAIGKPSLTLVINIGKLIATVVSLLATAGQPLVTVVWAFVIGQLCVSPLSYGLARRGFGLPLLETGRRLAPFLLGHAAMALAVFGLRGTGVIDGASPSVRGAVLGAAGLLSYGIVCAVFARPQVLAVMARIRKNRR